MEIEQLTALDAMWDKGTNLHHALLLANRHFRKHPNAQPVLLIVTDGEPTSHLESGRRGLLLLPAAPADGRVRRPRARQRRPARRADDLLPARRGPGLGRFIDQMAHRVDGGWSRRSSTTSVRPWSAPGSRAGRLRRWLGGGYGDWFGGGGVRGSATGEVPPGVVRRAALFLGPRELA